MSHAVALPVGDAAVPLLPSEDAGRPAGSAQRSLSASLLCALLLGLTLACAASASHSGGGRAGRLFRPLLGQGLGAMRTPAVALPSSSYLAHPLQGPTSAHRATKPLSTALRAARRRRRAEPDDDGDGDGDGDVNFDDEDWDETRARASGRRPAKRSAAQLAAEAAPKPAAASPAPKPAWWYEPNPIKRAEMQRRPSGRMVPMRFDPPDDGMPADIPVFMGDDVMEQWENFWEENQWESSESSDEKNPKYPGIKVIPDDGEREIFDVHDDMTGRNLVDDLHVGQELQGKLVAFDWDYGVVVDIGCEFDGLQWVHHRDIEDVREVLELDMEVTVRIRTLRRVNMGRWVWPIEVDIIQPNIAPLLVEPPPEWPPIRVVLRERQSLHEIAAEANRTIPDYDPQAVKDKAWEDLLAKVEQAKRGRPPVTKRQRKSRAKAPEENDGGEQYYRDVMGMGDPDDVDDDESEDVDAGDVPDPEQFDQD